MKLPYGQMKFNRKKAAIGGKGKNEVLIMAEGLCALLLRNKK